MSLILKILCVFILSVKKICPAKLRKTLFEKKKLEIIFFLYCLFFEKINNNM